MVLNQSNSDPEGTYGNIQRHFWTRGAAKRYGTHKIASPPTKNCQVQNVSAVKVEKPWSRDRDRQSFQNQILVIKGKFS